MRSSGVDHENRPRQGGESDTIVSRPRLNRVLDEASHFDALVITGPAGIGKTTLISSWLSGQDGSSCVAWIHGDEALAKADGLWQRVGQALFPEREVPPNSPGQISELVSATGKPVVLIIDHAEAMSEETVGDLFRFASTLVDARVLLASRSDFTRNPVWQTQFQLSRLGFEDLRFTLQEIEELASSFDFEVDASELLQRTGGFPLLTAMTMRSGNMNSRHASLAQWVSSLVDPRDLDDVRILAVVGVVSPNVVQLTTRREDPESFLDVMCAAGLGFRNELADFEFFPAMRDALTFSSEAAEFSGAGARARDIAITAYRADPHRAAVTLYLLAEGGRTHELWPHIVAHCHVFMREPDHLNTALNLIESHSTDAHPTVAVIRALVMRRRVPATSLEFRILVESTLLDLSELWHAADRSERTHAILGSMLIYYVAERLEAAEAILGMWNIQIGRMDSEARLALWPVLRLGFHVSALIYVNLVKYESALRVLDTAESVNPDVDDLKYTRAFVSLMAGYVDEARSLYENEIAFMNDPVFVGAKQRDVISRASLLLEAGNPELARDLLEGDEGDVLASAEWAFGLIVLSRTYVGTDPVFGLERIETLLRRCEQRVLAPRIRDLLYGIIADLALLAGDTQKAMQYVHDRSADDPVKQIAAARISLIAPDPDVVSGLAPLLDNKEIGPRLRAQVHLLLAIHLNRAGDAENACASIRRAFAITRYCGIGLIHALVPAQELRELADAAGIELPVNVPPPNPLVDPLTPINLTSRERVLLDDLASEKKLREIAEEHFLSINTIRSQAASLYRKLGVSSRREAVSTAVRRGLLILE